jgi:hypothetical protein
LLKLTRLYFHSALSGLSNLPTTRQGSTPGSTGAVYDLASTNRTMDSTIGSSQVVNSANSFASTTQRRHYFTRCVSNPFQSNQTIDAETWTYNIGTRSSNANANFPVSGTSQSNYASVFVWRPGTGLVGFIIDSTTNAHWNEYVDASGNGFIQHVTFSGSSVSAQAGDVLCIEIMFACTQASATAYEVRVLYDGGTVNTTPGTQMADIAAFLETPQNLSFVGDPISMNVTDTVVLTNKFITKV